MFSSALSKLGQSELKRSFFTAAPTAFRLLGDGRFAGNTLKNALGKTCVTPVEASGKIQPERHPDVCYRENTEHSD